MIALEGCKIERVLDASVEIVEAEPRNRHFPARVSHGIGFSLKSGPEHVVNANGRDSSFTNNMVCIRPPGSVWSVKSTGPVGFLSIDIEPDLLSTEKWDRAIKFVAAERMPNIRQIVEALRSPASQLLKEIIIQNLLDSVSFMKQPSSRFVEDASQASVSRARDLLESSVALPPSLQELADSAGANKFVLLRSFRKKFGLSPYAFVVRLRIEKARSMLARGAGIIDVAQSLGFADQSHLSRVFKRSVGVSPGVYKRQVSSPSLSNTVNNVQDTQRA